MPNAASDTGSGRVEYPPHKGYIRGVAVKFVSALITLLVDAGFSVAAGLFLIVALNGYSENDASYGLGAFAILAALLTIAMSVTAYIAASMLLKNGFRKYSSLTLSTLVFSIFGALIIAFCGILAMGIKHYVSLN